MTYTEEDPLVRGDHPDAVPIPARSGLEGIQRLVVFEAADARALLEAVEAPGVLAAVPQHREQWTLPDATADGEIPVWWWPKSADDFERQAANLLREFIFPLVAGSDRWVIGLPFGRDRLTRRSLSVYEQPALDLKDIGSLLDADGVSANLAMLPLVAGRLMLTPIEARLAEALRAIGVEARAQVAVGRYPVDFLAVRDGKRWAVEADGAGYHDVDRDAERDQELKTLGVDGVLRFHRAARSSATPTVVLVPSRTRSPGRRVSRRIRREPA